MSTATTTYTPTFLNDASIAKFSASRYDKMIEAGFFTSEDKVELLENYVVLKMPQNPPHAGTINLIQDTLASAVTGWALRVQLTIAFPDSRPEPDLALCRGRARDYLKAHPTPSDVGLLIEVANTSLLRDQRDKARIYARGNVVCYWIVNLDERRIEVHTQPSGSCESPAYASIVNFGVGDTVPLVLDGVTVASVPVAELLP